MNFLYDAYDHVVEFKKTWKFVLQNIRPLEGLNQRVPITVV
jgi:hypothetical protein